MKYKKKFREFPIEYKAKAMELLLSGMYLREVCAEIGCCLHSVSEWYKLYRGYKGPNFEIITKQSEV